MGACTYGAQVKVGEPNWYYVTKADIDTWFSGSPYLFLLWVYGWVGRGYSLPLLALLNPDVPVAVGWQALIASSLVGGRFNVVGTLADAMDQLIQYHVFLDHCQCLPPGGACPSRSGTFLNTGPDWSVAPDLNVGSQIESTHFDWHVVSNAGYSGSWRTRIFYYNSAGTLLATHQSVDHLGWPVDGSVDDSVVVAGATKVNWRIDTSPWAFGSNMRATLDYNQSVTCDAFLPSTPTSPGAVTTTGIPTVTAPSGTTSDQLMTQLLVQQFELRQLQDLIRSSPIGGSGLLPTPGTVHSGLSGDGEFACVALQGVRVQLVGVPTSVDRWIAHPDQYLGAGQLSFQGEAGWTDNLNAAHLDQYIPCPVPASTKVGYHFLGGITATITEYPS